MIAITGISGYIGCHISHVLQEKNIAHRGIIKKETAQTDLTQLDERKTPYSLVDFTDESQLYEALNGVDTVIHLIGSIFKPKRMTMDKLHKDITATMLRAAKRRNVSKIIYVSALGSRLDAPSDYHRTKALAEKEIRESGIPYVILQPSLIFGKKYGTRNSKLVARLAQSIEKMTFIPVIGSGKNKLQPFYILDLVRCVIDSCKPDIKNVTVELGGPQILPFEDIAKLIAKAVGQDQKKCIHIPVPVAAVLARIMQAVSDQPKITRDQVKMIRHDNICTSNTMDKLFPFKRTPMDTVLESLL